MSCAPGWKASSWNVLPRALTKRHTYPTIGKDRVYYHLIDPWDSPATRAASQKESARAQEAVAAPPRPRAMSRLPGLDPDPGMRRMFTPGRFAGEAIRSGRGCLRGCR